MKRSRLIVLAVLGALAAAGLVATPSGALVTCWGEALTLPEGTLVGTPGDDVMLGTAGDDVMRGLGGRDTICGGGGNDKVLGGAGFDRLRGEGGGDRLYGGAGCDWLQGGEGNDVLFPEAHGHACSGTAEGGPGRDRFVIDAEGDNELFGGLGVDTLDFRRSPSPITAGQQPGHYDSRPEYPGFPLVGSLYWQIENIYGSQWNDWLVGDAKRNRLLGFGGGDDLLGLEGDDYLDGGEGDDALDGGPGWDVCLGGESQQYCDA